MRSLALAILLLRFVAQAQPTRTTLIPGNPPGGAGSACTDTQHAYLASTGTIYTCQNSLWTASGGGGAVTSVFTRTGAVAAQSGDYTAAQVGLGSVTNDAQTKASIMPNTAPAAGQIAVGNAGGTAYAPVAISGDATLASTGAVSVVKVNGNTPGGTCTNQFTRSISSSGVPTCASVVNADISNSTIDLTAKVTGVLPKAQGGTASTLGAITELIHIAGTTLSSNSVGYMNSWIDSSDAAVSNASTVTGTVNAMYCYTTNIDTGKTVIYTLYYNGSPTAGTCTVTGPGHTCSATGLSIAISQGTGMSTKVDGTGTTSTVYAATCRYRVTGAS